MGRVRVLAKKESRQRAGQCTGKPETKTGKEAGTSKAKDAFPRCTVEDAGKELKRTEERIEKLESDKSKFEAEMAAPEIYSDFAKLNVVQEKFNSVTKELNEANAKWEELATAIDELNG